MYFMVRFKLQPKFYDDDDDDDDDDDETKLSRMTSKISFTNTPKEN